VYQFFIVNVDQPLPDTCQLESCAICNEARTTRLWMKLTIPCRSTSVCVFTKSLMFPFPIQSEIIANRVSDIVAPVSDRTFGCRRYFHITTSLQNLCSGKSVGLHVGGNTTSNPRRLSFESRYSSMSAKPLPRPPDRHVPPSTRPRIRPCTMRHGCDHSGRGSSRLLEEVHGDHTPCTTIGGISFVPMSGYLANPTPSWERR